MNLKERELAKFVDDLIRIGTLAEGERQIAIDTLKLVEEKEGDRI